MTEDESPDGDGTGQWGAAVDRYRDAAKWLVAAFGAIGAVIAGAAPLSALGDMPAGRTAYVVAGAALALAGITAVLVATVAVLVPGAVFGHQLVAKPRSGWKRAFSSLGAMEDLLARHPDEVLPAGITTVAGLSEAIANLRLAALAMSSRAASLGPADPAKGQAERSAQAMASTLQSHQRSLRELLSLARYQSARARFNEALVGVLGGGLLTAIGVGTFLYGASGKAG